MHSDKPTAPAARDQARVLRRLANLLNSALPLARQVLSDDYSVADRERLRLLTSTSTYGSHAVFELGNVLSGLCSEDARATDSPDPEVREAVNDRLTQLAAKSQAVIAAVVNRAH